MGTWGSLTTPETVPVIRQACSAIANSCAVCRVRWHTDPKTLTVVSGQVPGPDGAIYGYADLARSPILATALSVDASAINPNPWQVCGTSLAAINGAAIVRGALQYSSDLIFDQALHGCVLRPPNHRCNLLSYDASRAEKLPGVRVIREGDFLGVTGTTRGQAAAALALINAEWSEGKLGDPGTLFLI